MKTEQSALMAFWAMKKIIVHPPEHLELTENGNAKLQGEVFAVERLGGETFLYVNTETNEDITVHTSGDKVVGIGDLVSFGFSPQNCHLFNGQGHVFEKLAT